MTARTGLIQPYINTVPDKVMVTDRILMLDPYDIVAYSYLGTDMGKFNFQNGSNFKYEWLNDTMPVRADALGAARRGATAGRHADPLGAHHPRRHPQAPAGAAGRTNAVEPPEVVRTVKFVVIAVAPVCAVPDPVLAEGRLPTRPDSFGTMPRPISSPDEGMFVSCYAASPRFFAVASVSAASSALMRSWSAARAASIWSTFAVSWAKPRPLLAAFRKAFALSTDRKSVV